LDAATKFIGLGFLATAVAAGFSGWQAWTSSDTEQRSLRAYVGLADLTNSATAPKVESGRILVTMINYGATPAKDVEFYGNWEFVKPGVMRLPDDFTFPDKPYCPPERLYGGQTIFPKNTLQSKTALPGRNCEIVLSWNLECGLLWPYRLSRYLQQTMGNDLLYFI
jgi:hypothetical protein